MTQQQPPPGRRASPSATDRAMGADEVQSVLRECFAAYDGRSPALLSETADRFRDREGFLQAVLLLVADEHRMISEGATWVLKSELEKGACLDRALTARLIADLDKLTAWQAKLHICQIVGHFVVPEGDRETLRRWLIGLLDADRPFLRAWALDGLCTLPDTPVEMFLDRLEQDDAASVRARVRKIKQRIERRGPKRS